MSVVEVDSDTEESGNLLSHLPSIIRERYLLLVIPALLCTTAGVVAAFVMPKVYRSTATLLVESPMLPEDIAGAQDVDIVDQRIAKIRQQVLSRPRLIELIQKNRLYTKERANKSLSEVIQDMRDATKISSVSAELQKAGSGQSSTIAFALSFDYQAAPQAQAVAQDMTEQILLIDATKNSEQATNTVQFLTDQATALQTQISELERYLETVKAQNGFALSSNSSAVFGGSGGGYDAQIIGLQRDNAMLSAQREAKKTSAERDPLVSSAEIELAAAQARYSENHPDIAIAKRHLAEARKLAASNLAKQPADTIEQQIASNNAQIAALQSARAQENARMSATQMAQAKAPVIMEQIAQQQQKLDALNTQYEAVSTRLLSAQANAKAESEQKGERLSVIDPPVVADEPISPNRPFLIAGGLGFGLAFGMFLILLVELFYRPIRDAGDIRQVTGSMPLVSIPTIDANSEDTSRWWNLTKMFGFLRRKRNVAE